MPVLYLKSLYNLPELKTPWTLTGSDTNGLKSDRNEQWKIPLKSRTMHFKQLYSFINQEGCQKEFHKLERSHTFQMEGNADGSWWSVTGKEQQLSVLGNS